ncbi:MAG: hypothetical protein RI953_3124 [Pseudomonadota bacterium]
MRSTDDSRATVRLFLVVTATLMCLASANAFPAGKAKPDLPIGDDLEETHSPKAPAPKPKTGKPAAPAKKDAEKSPHASASAQHGEEKNPHASAPAQHGEEKDNHATKPAQHGEEKDPHATAPAQHGEEKDPHASAPAQHGEEKSTHSDATKGAKTEAHGEEGSHAAETPHKGSKTRLLEGKVDPATPAQGKGFIWFGVVFVVLAIAIFIFT